MPASRADGTVSASVGFQPWAPAQDMAAILGLSAFYHDSAAALVVDGEIVAAAQEERFSRKKHDAGFPEHSVAYCLREGGIDAGQLDYVGFYDKPFLKFDRLIETYLAFAPAGFSSFRQALPVWLKDKVHLRRVLRQRLSAASRARLVFTEHHESHAASAFFPSPFESAAILTVDGVGEWSTATLGCGEGNKLRLLRQLQFPHSLGLLYSAFTYYCGFKVNSGEYKLMGLAPYGQPRHTDLILSRLVDLKPDGSLRMDMRYFNYCQGLTMTNHRFHQLFGGPPRRPDETIEQRHMDAAASIQKVTEEILLRMVAEAHRQTGQDNLVMAGGVALNCVANGRIQREGPFKRVWIQPAAGDAGGALGVALFVWHQLLEKPRQATGDDRQKGSFLGPGFSTDEVAATLQRMGLPYRRFGTEAELLRSVAALLDRGDIVGWFQGRMEFGPRALGARSILGDARRPAMQADMNLRIKFRESFRPFAPCVLKERADEYFRLGLDEESPYMLMVAPVQDRHRASLTDAEHQTMTSDPDLRRRVNIARSSLPAVTHVDYSARVQTVDEQRHGRLYRLLKAFDRLTGCPVLVNTSFNVRGEPIVCAPEEACRCFLSTGMNALVIEDCLVVKDGIKNLPEAEVSRHLARFDSD
jgi:carbamoyltransferase